jgi:DNA-binding NarL/FixJ family response regulator
MATYNLGRDISVLIVEDHDGVRAAVRAILEAAGDIQVVGEAAEGSQAIALANQQHPDVLVLDLDLEVISGEIAVGRVLQQFPRTRVVMLTSYDDAEYCKGLLGEGAAGCVLKEDVPSSLVEAIHAVQEEPDHAWISPRLESDLNV